MYVACRVLDVKLWALVGEKKGVVERKTILNPQGLRNCHPDMAAIHNFFRFIRHCTVCLQNVGDYGDPKS